MIELLSARAVSARAGSSPGFVHSMEEVLRTMAQFAAITAEALAVIIIALALLEAVVKVVVVLVRDHLSFNERWDDVRLRLGRWLLLSLDFLVAADLLRTAVAPNWNELGQLAVVVLIRVVLEYFLESTQPQIRKEQEEENKRQRSGK